MSQIKDYILGIVFIPCFIVAVFLVWLLLTFIFSCCCCGRAGFLSGERFQEYDQRKCCNNGKNSRFTFIIAAALVVAFSALFSLEGLVNLESSINAINETIHDFHSLAGQGQTAADSLQGNVTLSKTYRDNAVSSLNPGLNNPLCSSTIQPIITSLMTNTSLDNYTNDYAQNFFDNIDINTSEVDTYLGYVKDNQKWANYVVPIVYSVLVSFFVFGTVAAWMGKSRNCFEVFLTCFLLPLFFILLVLILILAVLFGLVNVPLSDVCAAVQKVDPIVDAFNNVTDSQPGDLTDSIVRKVLSGCSPNVTDPFANVTAYQNELSSALNTAFSAIADAQAQMSTLTLCISSANVNVFNASLINLTQSLTSLNTSLDSILDVSSCQSLYGLYDTAVNTGLCNNIVDGFGWLFVATVVIATFMMVIITLRSSWKVNSEADDDLVVIAKEMHD